MARRVFVYCPERKKVVPRHEASASYRGRRHDVIPDIRPFESPVDGTVVGSRRDLREHNIRNNVEQVGNDMPPGKRPDFTPSFDRAFAEACERLG